MKKYNRRSSMTPGERLMFLAGTLFCLVLITTSMMGGLFARYTTTGSGSDSARVAKWDVDVNGISDVNIEYGKSDSEGAYTFTVDNKSEVAVEYNVKVEILPAAPDFTIQVALEGQTLDTKNGQVLNFGVAGSVPIGEKKTCELVFSVKDWAEFTQQVNGSSRKAELDFKVSIDVVQVD